MLFFASIAILAYVDILYYPILLLRDSVNRSMPMVIELYINGTKLM